MYWSLSVQSVVRRNSSLTHTWHVTRQPEEAPVECRCRVGSQLQSLHAEVPTGLLSMSPQLQTPTQAKHSDVHTRQTPGQSEVTYFLSALAFWWLWLLFADTNKQSSHTTAHAVFNKAVNVWNKGSGNSENTPTLADQMLFIYMTNSVHFSDEWFRIHADPNLNI